MAAPSDYRRGNMDIAEQASTFHGFIALSKWGSLVLAVAVLFLVMVFCTHAGLFQAFLASAVVAVAGGFMLRDKPVAGH
jgi:hypothetical protein